MNGTNITHESVHETWRHSLKSAATGGSVMEAIGGIAAVVLSIIALAGGLQGYMAAIAVILIGASLLFESGTLAASYRRLLFRMEGSASSSELGSTMTVECLAGITGIVLGILALLGIAPWTLTATAAVVFGSVFMLNSGALLRLHSLWASGFYAQEASREVAHDAFATSAGGHLLIGLAAVVLGILALVGINPVVLNLVALLALGVSVMLSGSFFGATRLMESSEA